MKSCFSNFGENDINMVKYLSKTKCDAIIHEVLGDSKGKVESLWLLDRSKIWNLEDFKKCKCFAK